MIEFLQGLPRTLVIPFEQVHRVRLQHAPASVSPRFFRKGGNCKVVLGQLCSDLLSAL